MRTFVAVLFACLVVGSYARSLTDDLRLLERVLTLERLNERQPPRCDGEHLDDALPGFPNCICEVEDGEYEFDGEDGDCPEPPRCEDVQDLGASLPNFPNCICQDVNIDYPDEGPYFDFDGVEKGDCPAPPCIRYDVAPVDSPLEGSLIVALRPPHHRKNDKRSNSGDDDDDKPPGLGDILAALNAEGANIPPLPAGDCLVLGDGAELCFTKDGPALVLPPGFSTNLALCPPKPAE